MMNELQNNSYLDCIPLELRLSLSEHYDHEIGEHDLLYLGKQNLDYLVNWWGDFTEKCVAYSHQLTEICNALEEAKRRIDAVGSFKSGEDIQAFDKLLTRSERAKDSLCAQTTHAEERHELLSQLASRAERKPLIFDRVSYCPGESVMLFIADNTFNFGTEPQFICGTMDQMSNLYVRGTVETVDDGFVTVKTEQNLFVQGLFSNKIRISAESLSMMKTEDFDYFKEDLRYFEMYLNAWAITATPDVKEAILTMMCAIKSRK